MLPCLHAYPSYPHYRLLVPCLLPTCSCGRAIDQRMANYAGLPVCPSLLLTLLCCLPICTAWTTHDMPFLLFFPTVWLNTWLPWLIPRPNVPPREQHPPSTWRKPPVAPCPACRIVHWVWCCMADHACTTHDLTPRMHYRHWVHTLAGQTHRRPQAG